MKQLFTTAMLAAAVFCSAASAGAQAAPAAQASQAPAGQAAVARPADDYIIGTDDVLSIVFWRDKDMSTETVVRPDGKITLPLLNDINAAGLTTDQLRERVNAEASKFVEDPAATVVIKQINSRKVYITGEIMKAGPYHLTGPTTVLQLIAMAGGLKEFAKRDNIVIMRTAGSTQQMLPFDYAAVSKRKKIEQNILLKPGDTIVVP